MSPPLRGDQVENTSVDSQDLSVHVIVLCQEEDSHAHLLLSASSHCGHMALVGHLFCREITLVLLVRILCRHLAGEVARRDTVDPDPSLLELRRHHLREVRSGCLCRIVRKVALRMTHHSGHGRNCDDRGAKLLHRTILVASLEEG